MKVSEWYRIPGMYMWRNSNGDIIEIKGTYNKGYYYVALRRNKIHLKQLGKKLAYKQLSPYFIFSEGVGTEGRAENKRIRELYAWQYGNIDNALRVVKKYVKGV